MELLVILLGEFLFFPFIAFFIFFVHFLISFIGGIISFGFFVPVWRQHGHQGVKYVKHIYKKAAFYPLILFFRICSWIFLLLIPAIILINLFFFEPTVRSIAAQIAQKKGMEISFAKAQGNLFSGTLVLDGLTVKSSKGTRADFDVQAKSVALDVDVFSLLSSAIIIERLRVDGVAGDISMKAKDVTALPSSAQQQVAAEPLKPKKAFVIHDLSILHVSLRLYNNSTEPLHLALNTLESKPFRSQYAIFDTFFRSNIQGRLDGQWLSITSREIPNGRETEWNLEDFPVAAIGAFTDKAPLNWFTSGRLTAQVKDRWQDGDHPEIIMDWSLLFEDARVEAPAGASLLSKTMTLPLINYINGKTEPVDLKFSLRLNERQFESASSLDAAGLWDATVAGLLESLAVNAGEKKKAIQQGVKDKIDGLKDFLKKDEDEPEEEGETKAPE
jgi:hypothetical protein